MVLQLQLVRPPVLPGPVYVPPGGSGGRPYAVGGKDTRWYEGGHSLPPVHVAIKYAATVHAF